MKVWLVTIGEPLPIDEGTPRLLRHGLLADVLIDHGHEVVWWTSAFDHNRKCHRVREPTTIELRPKLTMRMLPSLGYPTNRSPRRLCDHYLLAKKFAREARQADMPDIVLASYPTIELCRESVRFGLARGLPVVLDVRDAWPEIFVDMAPRYLRALASLALAPLFAWRRQALSGCTAILGITSEFVAWAAERGGRRPGALDKAFPLAYSLKQIADDKLAEADQFWDAQGVGNDDDILTVCFVGAIGTHFDFHTVFGAARLLERRGQKLRFVICGPREGLGSLLGASAEMRNIILPGWVDAAQIRSLMSRSHLALAPYRNTWSFRMSIPNKIIEYMAGGLPIVSGLDGSVRKLLDEADCGVTYKSGDGEGLAAVIETLAADAEARRRMASNAAAIFCECFSAEHVYAEMADHLEMVARKARAAGQIPSVRHRGHAASTR